MGGLPRLEVSANHRFLITEDGKPFFWLGDTAWELIHRLSRDDAGHYLNDRSAKGFNVVQTVALAELDGLHTPNAYGHLPLHKDDPAQPDEGYFQDVDFVIRSAAERKMYVAFLPAWADKVTPAWGVGPPVFTPANARVYGHFLGDRYRKDTNLVWVLGGDRPLYRDGEDYASIWRAMASGIREGSGGAALITYHPDGGPTTPSAVHRESWSDFTMIQSGHWAAENPTWDWIGELYRLSPAKPVLDGEPSYEDHPIAPWPKWDPKSGYFRDYEVRKQVYRSVFAGGCGVTYGHHFVWQMWEPGRQPMNNGNELIPWKEALNRPGAGQMRHLKELMLSRPYLTRIPDQTLIRGSAGAGNEHIRATRDANGRYAMIYFPAPGKTAELDLTSLAKRLRAHWFDPRAGTWSLARGEFSDRVTSFRSPDPGPDAVLVLDDVDLKLD